MGLIARLASGAAVFAVVTLAWPGSPATAAPGDGGLGLEVRSAPVGRSDQVQVTLKVTNMSTSECQLSTVAEGTVQVISVRRDGRELTPDLGRSFYLDGIGTAIKTGLTTTRPSTGVDVVLRTVRVDDADDATSVVLRSVASTPDGGGMDALWPFGVPGRYEVTVGYAVPALEGTTTCPGATQAQTVTVVVGERRSGFPWLWVLVGGVLLLAIIVGIVALARGRGRGGRRTAAAAIAIPILLATVMGTGRPARADYSVDPNAGIPVPGVDFPAAVEGCLKGFAAPGGDPAGILPRLKDPKAPRVRIIPTNGGSDTFETPKSKAGPGSSTITWNPTSVEPYGDGVARDPCAALYHEFVHADDISRNRVPKGECGDSGIKAAEVKATLAENRYRAAKGLPPRTEYDGKTLPKSMDECKKQKPKRPPQKGPIRLCEGAGANQCGSTNGDPHLRTFDREYYDLQSVGEFVLVRSTAGDALEVQTRQSPMRPSRQVSVNTAAAFRLGAHKVSLALVNGLTRVHIDGQPTAVPRGEKALPGGGTLVSRESDTGAADGYDLRWPDGSEAAVDPIAAYGYRVLVKLAPTRAGKVEGLLGNFDGDPTNDIAARGGPPLAPPITFEKLYPSYADSWRIRAADSLFTYADGESTETFTDRSFPERGMTVTDLDPATRARAEEICRWAGITEPWQLAECVFDVGVTGRSEFAVGAAGSELVAPPVAAPIAAAPLVSRTLTAGTTDKLTFDGKAGQVVFVDFIAPTLPLECSAYSLLNPGGEEINSGCNINGVGHIDRTVLPTDGQYAVVLDFRPGPTGPVTGRAMARVYVSQDSVGAIEPNGAPVDLGLEQPGAIARYTFTGRAGQRVFLDVSESSLPHQCSPLELRDPGDRLLGSGCVINGVGDIEGTVLPADGTYTVVVDPNDRTIGTVHMQLFASRDQRDAITVNGQPVVATIGQPGLVIRYEFTGTAGTAVTVDATNATLPDQCSPIQLRDPAENLIGSGCVINGSGDIRPTVLPTTGTYTIVVDPSGAATGTVTLTLKG
jgi:hypothetical protein